MNVFSNFDEPLQPLLLVRGSIRISDDLALSRVLHTVGSAEFGNHFHRLILAVEEGRVVVGDEFARDLRGAVVDIQQMRRDMTAAVNFKPLSPIGAALTTQFEQV